MPFKKNDYIKDKEDGTFRRILSIHDDIVHLSDSWIKEEAHKKWRGLESRQECTDIHLTLDELNAYYEPSTPAEAGFPEEETWMYVGGDEPKMPRWKPHVGISYSYMDAYGNGCGAIWQGDRIDEWRYCTGNVFKTEEVARAYYDSIMKD